MFDVIFKAAIEYLSEVLNLVAPNEITPDAERGFKTAYAVAKIWGPKLVSSTETEYDDLFHREVLEICEDAAKKYGFSLNPVEL